MSVTITFFFFVFSENKTLFFVSLAPFSVIRGPNLSAVNYQNPGNTPEKIKPTLSYRHYIADITLRKLHYGRYD